AACRFADPPTLQIKRPPASADSRHATSLSAAEGRSLELAPDLLITPAHDVTTHYSTASTRSRGLSRRQRMLTVLNPLDILPRQALLHRRQLGERLMRLNLVPISRAGIVVAAMVVVTVFDRHLDRLFKHDGILNVVAV